MNTNREFDTVLEAIEHMKMCPVCGSEILPDISRMLTETNPSYVDIASDNVKISVGYGIVCENCQLYTYTLRLDTISNEPGVVKKVLINSEEMSIEADNVLYEIRNAYGTKKTRVTIFIGNKDGKKIDLPLLSHDMLQPHSLLNKVKNLIIFS